ncbi:MAG: GTPase [Gemmataceae bacterium]
MKIGVETKAHTSIACLTPPGSAALATLALYGPDAWRIVRTSFQPRGKGQLPEQSFPGKFWLGKLGAGPGDEVVVALKQLEPVPYIEIHCHGGREVLKYLHEHLVEQGAAPASWEEMIAKTEGDPSRARALIELAQAPTVRTASIILEQYQGAFDRALAQVRAALERKDGEEVRCQLKELMRHANLGRHLTRPWRVVLAGAPNVGKSSLANRLAGYLRSVVDSTPGTTRDLVTTRLALDGWPVELSDTAGVRHTKEELEGQGVALALSAAAEADLCLWLLDGSAEPIWPDSRPANLHLAINKVDLPPAWNYAEAGEALRVSAVTGVGIEELCAAVSAWLVPDAPLPGTAVPFTPEICDRLEELLSSLNAESPGAIAQKIKTFWD